MQRAWKIPVILSLVCVFALAACLCPVLAQAEEDDDADVVGVDSAVAMNDSNAAPTPTKAGNIASGTWGTCPWEIDSGGILTVHPGTGVEQSFGWTNYSDSITSVVFKEEGGRKVVAPECTSYMFAQLTKVTSIDLSGLDTSNVTDMSYMFCLMRGESGVPTADLTALTSLDLTPLDTSNVTDMGFMFWNCTALTSLDLTPLDTSRVTSMRSLFRYCVSLETVDLSTLDTSNVENMTAMFQGCEALTALDLSSFDTSKVTNMSYLFWGCSSLDNTDFTLLETQSVKTMLYMFCGCSSLKTLDFRSFDTSSVTNMESVFRNCTSLESVILSSFDTSHVTEMGYMFMDCPSLKTIYVSDLWTTDNLDTSSYASRRSLFMGCTSLVGGNGTAYSASNVNANYAHIDAPGNPGYLTSNIIATGTWGTCPWEFTVPGTLTVYPGTGVRIGNLGVAPWAEYADDIKEVVFAEKDGRKVIAPEDSSYLLYRLRNVVSVDLSGLDTSNVTNMDGMFMGCEDLMSLDLSPLDTSSVTYMLDMFKDCSSLASLDLSSLDASHVTTMGAMFYGCTSLTSLDLSSLDTSSLVIMGSMFAGCTSLKALGLSGLDTSNVATMSCMFLDCSSLSSLDLSDFDTSKVTNMERVFEGCSSLVAVYVGDGWSTESVLDSLDHSMFLGCTSLVGGNGTAYDPDHIDAEYARLDEPGTPGYFTRKEVAKELADNNRYGTAVEIAEEAYPHGAAGVIVATGKDFPDALGAASLAGMLDYPILLTEPGSLPQVTCEAITELGATEAIVVGGTGAVSQRVFSQLQGLLGDDAVTRVHGKDRYKTAEAVYTFGLSRGRWGTTAVIATGTNYPDALSVSGYSFSFASPIFLCNPDKGLTTETKAALESGGFDQVVIVGGEGVVPESVAIWASDHVTANVVRLAGENRYETAARIAQFALDSGATADGACIATGKNFPDALAGGPLVGRINAVLLLADPGNTITLDILTANSDEVEHIYFLGGPGAVPQVVRDEAKSAAELG